MNTLLVIALCIATIALVVVSFAFGFAALFVWKRSLPVEANVPAWVIGRAIGQIAKRNYLFSKLQPLPANATEELKIERAMLVESILKDTGWVVPKPTEHDS